VFRYDFPRTVTEDAVLYRQVEEHRPRILGEMMSMLSKAVTSMKINTPPKMPFRMVAFAELGWHLHKAGCFEGRTEDDWIELLGRLSKAQLELAGERDSTVEIVRELMEMNTAQRVVLLRVIGFGEKAQATEAFATSQSLITNMQMKDFYKAYAWVAADGNYPFVKSPNALSRKLTAFKRAIESALKVKLLLTKQHGRAYITIKPDIDRIESEIQADTRDAA
jgi:hypothetical protein